jgi:hypothetical protein
MRQKYTIDSVADDPDILLVFMNIIKSIAECHKINDPAQYIKIEKKWIKYAEYPS